MVVFEAMTFFLLKCGCIYLYLYFVNTVKSKPVPSCENRMTTYFEHDCFATVVLTLMDSSNIYCLGQFLQHNVEGDYVTSQHVLTSASCLDRENINDIRVSRTEYQLTSHTMQFVMEVEYDFFTIIKITLQY